MNIRYLLRRARTLYPMAPYLSKSAVRHNRRQWVRAVCALGKKWVGHPSRRLLRPVKEI